VGGVRPEWKKLFREVCNMRRTIALLTVVGLTLGISSALLGQDKAQVGKARGTLPQNWNKLGLTDDQKQKVYTAQAEYKTKIDELQKQIDDLKKKQRVAMESVLTDAQKARLKEIALEKAGVGDDKKPDKKPEEAKKP
jgi:Spy/CpxP family protein refolding chaperone